MKMQKSFMPLEEAFVLRFNEKRYEIFSPHTIHEAYMNNSLKLLPEMVLPHVFLPLKDQREIEKATNLLKLYNELDKHEKPLQSFNENQSPCQVFDRI